MKSILLMFCGGYPSESSPQKGIFTHRSALALNQKYEVKVVLLRAFNFRRKFIQRYVYDGIEVTQLSFFQVPHWGNATIIAINSSLLSIGIRLLLSSDLLKTAAAFHSTMLVPTSIAVQPIADLFSKRHIGQAIGDDVNIYLPKLRNLDSIIRRIKKISFVQCNSMALKKSFLNLIPSKEESTFVLYRGVDADMFKPNENEFHDPLIFKVLFLGGVQTCEEKYHNTLNTKGAHILMDAWKRFAEENEGVQLTFGGPGSQMDCVEKWRNSLTRPELIDVIGTVNPKDVPNLLLNHQLVVIPSLYEGLPNLANEAQSAGVPVIASDTGGIPESVKSGVTGWLFKRGDGEDLAKKLAEAYRNRSMLNTMGYEGRLRSLRLFSWDNFVDTLEKKIDD